MDWKAGLDAAVKTIIFFAVAFALAVPAIVLTAHIIY